MLFAPQMNIIFAIRTSNNLIINKIYAWERWRTSAWYLPGNASKLKHFIYEADDVRASHRAHVNSSKGIKFLTTFYKNNLQPTELNHNTIGKPQYGRLPLSRTGPESEKSTFQCNICSNFTNKTWRSWWNHSEVSWEWVDCDLEVLWLELKQNWSFKLGVSTKHTWFWWLPILHYMIHW